MAHHTRTRTALLLAVLPVTALTAACGATDDATDQISEQIAEEAAEQIAEAAGAEDVEIDASEGEISIEGEGGSFSAEAGGDLPDGWPDEVPLPEEYEILTSSKLGDGETTSYSVIMRVPDDPEAAFDSLVAEYADWEEFGRTQSGAGADFFGLVDFTDDTWRVNLSIIAGDPDGATVSVTVQPAEA